MSWLLSPGSPGHDEPSQPPDGTGPGDPEAVPAEPEAAAGQAEAAPGTADLLVRHLPSYDEVANIAVFAASDWARTMTASEINFTGGAVVD